MAFQELSGSVGGAVLTRAGGVSVMKRKPRYKYPVQPSQRLVHERLRAAAAAWNGLSWEQAEAWNRYAKSLKRVDEFTGQEYEGKGINAFTALATKVLQVDPSAPIPLSPPTWEMRYEMPLVTVSDAPGAAIYTASGPTLEGIVAELMAQPLLNERRSPTKFYKSQAFAAFTAGELSAQVPLAPGWWALAVRFVEASTGRQGLVLPLRRLEVSE